MNLLTVILSAGVGAAVSAIAVLVSSWMQSRSQERVALATRDHERTVRRNDDERALRDERRARLRQELLLVADVAMRLLDAVQLLNADPRRQVGNVEGRLVELSKRVEAARAGLVLDSESDQLLVKLFELLRQYQGLASTWGIQIQTADNAKGGGPGAEAAVQLAEKASSDADSLQTSIHEAIGKARGFLRDLEQPIG